MQRHALLQQGEDTCSQFCNCPSPTISPLNNFKNKPIINPDLQRDREILMDNQANDERSIEEQRLRDLESQRMRL